MAKATTGKAASRPAAKPSAKATPKVPIPVTKPLPAGRALGQQIKGTPGKATPVKGGAPKGIPAKAATAPKAAAPPKPTTVTLKHVAAALGGEHGLAPKEAHGLIAAVFEAIVGHLKAGARVRMDGFGVIEVRDRAARMGRNPATGEAIQIAASRKLVFRAAKELKATV